MNPCGRIIKKQDPIAKLIGLSCTGDAYEGVHVFLQVNQPTTFATRFNPFIRVF